MQRPLTSGFRVYVTVWVGYNVFKTGFLRLFTIYGSRLSHLAIILAFLVFFYRNDAGTEDGMVAAGEYWHFIASAYAVALVLMAGLLTHTVVSYRSITKRSEPKVGKHASQAL
ncbi:MAG: heme exporter protein CcmD [Proteobacteria bacterium]|nr:heme exporter protein CcmD [Pseudomonadota bacterium]